MIGSNPPCAFTPVRGSGVQGLAKAQPWMLSRVRAKVFDAVMHVLDCASPFEVMTRDKAMLQSGSASRDLTPPSRSGDRPLRIRIDSLASLSSEGRRFAGSWSESREVTMLGKRSELLKQVADEVERGLRPRADLERYGIVVSETLSHAQIRALRLDRLSECFEVELH